MSGKAVKQGLSRFFACLPKLGSRCEVPFINADDYKLRKTRDSDEEDVERM